MIFPIAHRNQLCIVGYYNGTAQLPLGSPLVTRQPPYMTSSKDNLNYHVKSKHTRKERVRYDCDQCDYQATERGSVKTHIQNIHEGVRHDCNHCDYKATQKSNLKYHIKSKHTQNISTE